MHIVSMIPKTELVGKYVTFVDRDSKWRTEKVVRQRGNWLTVRNALKVKHRVHKDKVIGRQYPKKGREEIRW